MSFGAWGSAGLRAAAGHSKNVLKSGWDRPLPKVGIDDLDKLAVGTEDYLIWKRILKSKGINVVETEMRPGLRAYFESASELRVDPNQFRVLDILHETRHYKQIQRAKASGLEINFSSLNKRLLDIAEYDAYRYEYELGKKFGFNDEYMNYLQQRLYDFWGKQQKKIIKKPFCSRRL